MKSQAYGNSLFQVLCRKFVKKMRDVYCNIGGFCNPNSSILTYGIIYYIKIKRIYYAFVTVTFHLSTIYYHI